MSGYVVVVRYPNTTATRLYDRRRHPDAQAAGEVANTLNASGELGNAVAFYREASAEDIAETHNPQPNR